MKPPSQFTFDSNTGVVHGPSDVPFTVGKREFASWTVCEHLRALLADQLAAGARIEHVTGPGAWSRIDLDVSLNRVMASALPTKATLRAGLDLWTNTDTHYPLQSGVSCESCRQTFSWPIVR